MVKDDRSNHLKCVIRYNMILAGKSYSAFLFYFRVKAGPLSIAEDETLNLPRSLSRDFKSNKSRKP
jgi:hypothetical protein